MAPPKYASHRFIIAQYSLEIPDRTSLFEMEISINKQLNEKGNMQVKLHCAIFLLMPMTLLKGIIRIIDL